jgi:hypothetical protein
MEKLQGLLHSAMNRPAMNVRGPQTNEDNLNQQIEHL